MSVPFTYDFGAPLAFGGALPHVRSFDDSMVVILPVPVDRERHPTGRVPVGAALLDDPLPLATAVALAAWSR